MSKIRSFITHSGVLTAKMILSAVFAVSFLGVSSGAEKAKEPEKQPETQVAKVADYTTISKATKKKLTSKRKLSKERIEIIEKVIEKYMKENADITSEKIKSLMYADIAEKMPLDPENAPDVSTPEEIAKEASAIVAKQYPLTAHELSAGVEKKLAEEYKQPAMRESVTVLRRRGAGYEKVSGKLYKITKKDVRIGDVTVPFMDMDDASRMKLDDAFRKEAIAKDAAKEIKTYNDRKSIALDDTIADLKKKQVENNEKAGYILCKNNWGSAKLVANGIIKLEAPAYMKARQAKLDAIAAAEAQKEAEAKAEKEKAEAAAKAEQEKLAPAFDEEKHAAAVAKAEKMIEEINSKYNGIDAEQGYKKAVWGLTRSEVHDVLAKEEEFKNLKQEINSDVLFNIDGNEAKSLVLHYYNNELYKTTENLGNMTSEELIKYADGLHEILGPAVEEREHGKDKNLIDAMESGDYVQDDAKAGAKTAAKDKKGKKEKQEEAKQVDVSRDYAFNWDGQISSARLTFKMHKDAQGAVTYENVVLVKEVKK